jgi:DNA-binding transcriptional ArsR family regulator
MSSEEEVAALRALAHPTRTKIIELLRDRPSMTATECAGVLHLSPKSASYHLATLASSGLIEEVSVPGRNRPWRLVAGAAAELTGVQRPAIGGERARKAARDRREESLLDQAADAIARAAPQWSTAVAVHTRVTLMSPAEVLAWVDEVERVTSRHVRKAAIPDGTVRTPVHLLFCGFPTREHP